MKTPIGKLNIKTQEFILIEQQQQQQQQTLTGQPLGTIGNQLIILRTALK